MVLDLRWALSARVNAGAVFRHAAALAGRRTVIRDREADWLLRCVTLVDLTALSDSDTEESILRLCAQARRPIREDLLHALGASGQGIRVAAVCVSPVHAPVAVAALAGSGIPVASVAGGFPSGVLPRQEKVDEIRRLVAAGVDEIDAVIARSAVLRHEWTALYDEVAAFRQACGPARLKVILGTGELGCLRNVAIASRIAMMAGADLIKTSTGKEAVNATLPVGIVMTRAIRAYAAKTGCRVGFKPAGGIRTASQALDWMVLVQEELGQDWLHPSLLRIGASSLVSDIERALERTPTESCPPSHPPGTR